MSVVVIQAVGMWESRSDFHGRWEGWKTGIWFSWLSTGRHFHGSITLAYEWLVSVHLSPGIAQDESPFDCSVLRRLAKPSPLLVIYLADGMVM
jgi:hypothetical protein